jgi:hypothetical protein
VKSWPRLASTAFFLCLIDAHLEWPAIGRKSTTGPATGPGTAGTLVAVPVPALITARALLAAEVAVLVAAGPAAGAQQPIGDGAWSWFGDPRAVTHNGRTYVGWVDHEGDIKVSSSTTPGASG